jgi:hypothetical protein
LRPGGGRHRHGDHVALFLLEFQLSKVGERGLFAELRVDESLVAWRFLMIDSSDSPRRRLRLTFCGEIPAFSATEAAELLPFFIEYGFW